MEGSFILNFSAKFVVHKFLRNQEDRDNFLFEQLSTFLAYLCIYQYTEGRKKNHKFVNTFFLTIQTCLGLRIVVMIASIHI